MFDTGIPPSYNVLLPRTTHFGQWVARMPEWRPVPNRSAKRDASPDDDHERNHRGLGNAPIDGEQQDVAGADRIVDRIVQRRDEPSDQRDGQRLLREIRKPTIHRFSIFLNRGTSSFITDQATT